MEWAEETVRALLIRVWEQTSFLIREAEKKRNTAAVLLY